MLERKDLDALTHDQLAELFLYVQKIALGAILRKPIDNNSIIEGIKNRVEEARREERENIET